MIKLIFLGSPGVGKGTYADAISQEYGIPHISTGDIFRAKKNENSELGRKIKSLIDKGEFVDDETTLKIVAQRLKEADCRAGYILDGFPRTLYQAENFKEKVTAVFNFDAKRKTIIDRLSGRRVCSNIKCNAIFHIKNNPPRSPGICDVCGHDLVQRKDEAPDVIKRRLEIYEEKTKPLIDYYIQKKLLVPIDANGTIAEVVALCKRALVKLKK
jgi:adenylate kinase